MSKSWLHHQKSTNRCGWLLIDADGNYYVVQALPYSGRIDGELSIAEISRPIVKAANETLGLDRKNAPIVAAKMVNSFDTDTGQTHLHG